MSNHRAEMVKFVRQIRRTEGWSAEVTGGGHWKITTPDGRVIFGPYSPSDHRSIRNLRSRLRKFGFVE